jgi:hypothetical protein
MILETTKSLLIHYVTVNDAHLLPSDSAWNIRFQFWLIWCFQSLFVDVLNQFLSIQWASGILVTCIATPLWWRQKVVLWRIKSALLIVNLYRNWVKRLSTFAAINSQWPSLCSEARTAQSVKWLWSGQPNFYFQTGQNFVFATMFRPALGPTQPSIQWAPGVGSMVLTLGVRVTTSIKCQGKEYVEPSLHSPICNYDVRCLNFSGHVFHYCKRIAHGPSGYSFATLMPLLPN